MQQKNFGKTGVFVSAIGYGAMPLSLDGRPNEEDARKLLHFVFDLGITLIDTADSYCIDESEKHFNEKTICEALQSYPKPTEHIRIATKGGIIRPNGRWDPNGDPDYLYKTITESYQALGGSEPIFLWQHHVPDENFPVSASLSAAKRAQEEGLVSHIGVSNYSVAQIKEAQKVVEIVSVQNQFNPWYRKPEHDGVLQYCEEQGLVFLPWSPLGGMGRAKSLDTVTVLEDAAQAKGVSPQQIALAWLMSKSDQIIPIPGASRIDSVKDCVASLELKLSENRIKKIDSSLS